MKKFILKTLGLLASSAVIFMSCNSVKDITTYSNEIKSDKIAINTYFDKNEYSIIGSVEGESDFVWYNSSDDIYEGDSGKYGFISEPTTINVGEKVVLGTGKRTSANYSDEEIVRRARLNANYLLIENAYNLGGDSILEPVYSIVVEKSNETGNEIRKAKVKVRAKVIRLKTN